MAQITVRFDNQLEQSDIIIPLTNSSYKESGESYVDNRQEIQQTSIYGIRAPLIMINHTVIDFMNVIDFKMDSVGRIPTISMTVIDNYGFIGTIDNPGIDNELRLQILPQFDNAYKKIDLTFFITSIRVSGKNIILSGIYKSQGLSDTRFELFGQQNTYDTVSNIAKNIKLGLASNIDQNNYDKRYIYCNNITYQKLLDREVNRGGTQEQILDWWIDYWNNINLVDVYERYNAIDTDEDMMIWISGQTKEITEAIEVQPLQCVASLTNNPVLSTTDLSVSDYSVKNNLGAQVYKGTDKVYSIFETDKDGYMDYLVQDGDVKKDIFIHCEYLGESCTEQNFLLKSKLTEDYLQKINTQTIEVVLKVPMLQLMRGSHCNFLWYINDSKYANKLAELEENGVIEENDNPMQIDSTEAIQNDLNGLFELDKSISGQYMIIGNTIKYRDGRWETVLVLARPASINPQTIIEE